jgi:hypothetical protein
MFMARKRLMKLTPYDIKFLPGDIVSWNGIEFEVVRATVDIMATSEISVGFKVFYLLKNDEDRYVSNVPEGVLEMIRMNRKNRPL